ncbi:MAG: hypothetical protein ACOC2M_00640 [bacterium]
MNWNKAIGGYFELELNDFGGIYHNDLIALNSGRNAFEFILLQNDYKKVFIPYYTCDVILQPLKRLNLDFEYYHMDESFMPLIKELKGDEVLIYTNYYGLGTHLLNKVISNHKNVIIDNSQAFFEVPQTGVPTFYSPRKFFGVPDGGFAYVPQINKEINLKEDISEDRISHLIRRIDRNPEDGYALFKQNDAKLDNLPVRKMSNLTKKLLMSINYNQISNQRKQNFETLHKHFYKSNELSWLIEKGGFHTPMVYPYLNKNSNMRKALIENKIFVPTYWPNVFDWTDKNAREYYYAKNVLPLPIDQRYEKKDMERIIKIIRS